MMKPNLILNKAKMTEPVPIFYMPSLTSSPVVLADLGEYP